MAAKALLMVEPSTFAFNRETSFNNFFQKRPGLPTGKITDLAIEEFDSAVRNLRAEGIEVYVYNHGSNTDLPDAVFPNNWVAFLPGGTTVIFPMMAQSRRNEKTRSVIELVARESGYNVRKILDLGYFEEENKFLEGTGSIVFDHQNKLAFACISPRTNEVVLRKLCEEIGYSYLVFHAIDRLGRAIYHTNVMMAITGSCAIVCFDSIADQSSRDEIRSVFQRQGRETVELTMDQVDQFAGNMLEVIDKDNKSVLVMSQHACLSLSSQQLDTLSRYHRIVTLSLATIESAGGGSARCMMAEIFVNTL